jgi:AcrR family transcriptional regulator
MPPRKPRPEPSSAPYHHGDLRRVLVETALAMVREEGTWNFTLREVARRADVSHAAPYNHFADKSALLAEVAVLGFEALRQDMAAAARPGSGASHDALAGIGTTYVLFGVRNPAHYRLMFGPDLADRERHPTLAVASDAAFAALTDALAAGQATGELRPGSVRDQALAAWSLVHGLTMLLIDRRLSFLGLSTAEAERHARVACGALFEGIAQSAA